MAAHQGLVVSGDAARTIANILANDVLHRSSIAAGIVATSCYLAVTILLCELLRPVNKTVALLAASFSVIGCALGAVRAAFASAPTLVPRTAGGSAFSTEQLQALSLMFLSFGDQTEQLGLVFFGVFCALIGYLIFVSTFLPRIVGGLMALAGLGWLTFLWPPLASGVFPFNVALGGLGELTLTIWLLFAGLMSSAGRSGRAPNPSEPVSFKEDPMSEPVAYVSTWRIKGGKFEDYRRFYAELVKIVDENEPRLSAFLTFASEDLTEITNVHVFPDSETLDRHMEILGEKMRLVPGDLSQVMRYLEGVRVEVFGRPPGNAAEMDKGLAEAGVPFTFKPRYLGGFTRHRR